MDYIKYTQRLEYLLDLINKGQVSSPKIVAERFYCSEKTIRNMINRLREKGYNIYFSRGIKKYVVKHIDSK